MQIKSWLLYSGMNRGIQNYYRFADNSGYLAHIQYILKFSLAKTLAAKYKRSVSQIFKRLRQKLSPSLSRQKTGDEIAISLFYSNSDWKKQRNGFRIGQGNSGPPPMEYHHANPLKTWHAVLYLREPHTQVEMHHVRHIRKTGGKRNP